MVDQKAAKTAVKTELESSHQKIRKLRKMLKRTRIFTRLRKVTPCRSTNNQPVTRKIQQ